MKMLMAAAASLGCLLGGLALAGCEGKPGIEGKWCATVGGEAHSITAAKGKLTADTGQTASYVISGTTITATDDANGSKNNLSLSADGNTMTVEGQTGMPPFTRCK